MVTVVNCQRDTYEHYIGRPSIYGNPASYRVSKYAGVKVADHDAAVNYFFDYWYAPEQEWLRARALREIGPNDRLGCFCRPYMPSCHGDIIADYINCMREEL